MPLNLGERLHNCNIKSDLRPICPQMPGFVANHSRGWGGNGGPLCPPLEEKEFECLRLTVSAPDGHKSGQNLPVMVWIHGYSSSEIVLIDSGAMTAGGGASYPRESKFILGHR